MSGSTSPNATTFSETGKTVTYTVPTTGIYDIRFRDTTLAAAMRQAWLEAVRQALALGEIEGTVGDIAHRYDFANPGRRTSLYKTAFGASPAKALRRPPAPARGIA